MNIFEILKQFKTIEPDPAFSEKSKRMIFASTPARSLSVRQVVLRVLEGGVAVALTGFFIILITGGFTGTRLSPVPFSAIDPASIKAEAQAIDIQIQLSNLNYTEPAAQSTAAIAGVTSTTTVPAVIIAATSTGTGTATTSTSATASTTVATSTTISVDQALQELAK